MVVQSKNGAEHLVPYIKDRVIKKVDLDNNLMTKHLGTPTQLQHL